ncbi:MAG TPA: adenosine deaminase [Blastocatellia bacterium]|nr:adenosine deaminase [Blastocatellia bacterium]HMV84182.1 adenosine deaminase [Blastocatellia bacterium]HMX28830.1 adenosine deaminase [Blastocatellia bacterium]HMY71111.1 adenosine deaminase [Blastocatellia bacterium]HMZ19682.1 adenosine deaminase [Blastocatellia bacterium]
MYQPPKDFSRRVARFAFLLLWLLTATSFVAAQPAASPEQRVARQLDAVKTNPLELYAFLREMPKGADLHLHLSGSVYAESYIEWAAKANLCVNPSSYALMPCSASNAGPPAGQALTDGVLYRRMVDAWSMRNAQLAGLSGHDQFFDAFAKFGPGGDNRFGDMAAEVARRAAAERVGYLEIMLTPDNGKSRAAGRNLEWPTDEQVAAMTTAELNAFFAKKREELLANGILKTATAGQNNAVQESTAQLNELEARQRELLMCADEAKADPACRMTIRYVYQVGRTNAPREAFAQMVGAMEIMKAEPRIVALNLVQPEDARSAMKYFSLQMKMLDYLRSIKDYEKGNITLHAGELAPGLVAPEGLRFHIRESVQLGHATRIGHGVDVMYEDKPYELLKEMAAKRVLVEVCLTSNDAILGVRGKEHPLPLYLKYGVPAALATDDLGISRAEMTREYVRAVQDQGLTYPQLKALARNSLEHSFVGGLSYWKDPAKFIPATICLNALVAPKPSAECQRLLDASPRARLQWDLEKAFAQFEKQVLTGK